MVTRPKKGKTSITVYRTDQAGEAEPISWSCQSKCTLLTTGVVELGHWHAQTQEAR